MIDERQLSKVIALAQDGYIDHASILELFDNFNVLNGQESG